MRPYVLLKQAASLDGHLDDAGPDRLILSGPEDLDRADDTRASCDAVLVGAGTVRADDPRLAVRSEARRRLRAERGLPPDPLKVALSRSGRLDPAARFFTAGDGPKLVYGPAAGVAAEVAPAADLPDVLADLWRRGVRRLLVEGGTAVATDFLTAGLVDEYQLSVAPFFVGDPAAPRLVGPGRFPHDRHRRMHLAAVERLGDVALLTFRSPRPQAVATDEDRRWMAFAVELSRKCPRTDRAFSVGCVIVNGGVVATGYSREEAENEHAEELALRRADPEALRGATLYSSLEPCSVRLSGRRPCADRIARGGVVRVAYAMAEPATFVECQGARVLRENGLEVVEMTEFAAAVAEVNRHLG